MARDDRSFAVRLRFRERPGRSLRGVCVPGGGGVAGMIRATAGDRRSRYHGSSFFPLCCPDDHARGAVRAARTPGRPRHLVVLAILVGLLGYEQQVNAIRSRAHRTTDTPGEPAASLPIRPAA